MNIKNRSVVLSSNHDFKPFNAVAYCICSLLFKGPVRRAVWPLRLQSGLAAAEPLLKEVTLIPT